MTFQHISIAALQAMISNQNDLILVDVREPEEIASTGKIPSAREIPLMQFLTSSLVELQITPADFIVINCHSGQRSQTACQHLVQLGCERVYNLDGGIVAWHGAGYSLNR